MKPINRYFKSVLLLVVSSMPVYASPPLFSGHITGHVLIIRSADTPAHLAVERSFRVQLSQRISQLISLKSASLDSPTSLNALFSPESLQKTHFIITIGARAAHDVLSRSPDAAVLSVFVPRRAYHAIIGEVSAEFNAKNRSAIYLDQPDERLVLLAKLLGNQTAKISLLSGAEPSAGGSGGLLKTRQCGGENMSMLMSDVRIYRQVISSRTLKRTLKRSDIIIATPEMVKQSPNAVKWLLYMAYQRNVPVVGYSKAFVDAGALAAVYSTPEDIGRQTAEMFLNSFNYQLRSQPSSKPKKVENESLLMYPSYFQVRVNNTVADALGYSLSSRVQAVETSTGSKFFSAEGLRESLIEAALNCKENYVPLPANEVKQQMTRR